MPGIGRIGSLLAILALATPAIAQSLARAGGPFSRAIVLDAPFSADATTQIEDVLPDGTVRLYTVAARYYRDSQGRVRE